MRLLKMDKKDIYEHLAKIYLDASLKKPKKKREYPNFKNLFFLSLTVICVLIVLVLPNLSKKRLLSTEVSLVLQPDTAKINFHFDPAKKEIYSLNLNRLDLTKYRTLAFSVKKHGYKNSVCLRVEFKNSFREISEVYLKDIPVRWKEYKINFPEFKNISDWSEMSGLAFIIEEWNTKESHGVVFLDNIRFLK